MVSCVNLAADSPMLISIITAPITIPPKIFIIVIIIPAMASPLTNLDAPSIAP